MFIITIKVNNITCFRGERYLFRNLSFFLESGQITLVQGHNGAGKSTLLKIVAGLIVPKKGKVTWEGSPIQMATNYTENMSYLGHQNGVRKILTPLENILSQSHIERENINKVLEKFTLTSAKLIPCRQLSQGQCRKVALAILLLKNRKIWILDEPFTALDSQGNELLTEILVKRRREGGITLLASHQSIGQPVDQVIDL